MVDIALLVSGGIVGFVAAWIILGGVRIVNQSCEGLICARRGSERANTNTAARRITLLVMP